MAREQSANKRRFRAATVGAKKDRRRRVFEVPLRVVGDELMPVAPRLRDPEYPDHAGEAERQAILREYAKTIDMHDPAAWVEEDQALERVRLEARALRPIDLARLSEKHDVELASLDEAPPTRRLAFFVSLAIKGIYDPDSAEPDDAMFDDNDAEHRALLEERDFNYLVYLGYAVLRLAAPPEYNASKKS